MKFLSLTVVEISLTKNLERKKEEQIKGRTNRRNPICNPTIQLVVVDLYTKYEVCMFTKYEGYRYHKLRKAFSKFYRRHFDIVSKYNVGLKTLLLQGLQNLNFMATWCINSEKYLVKTIFLIISKR